MPVSASSCASLTQFQGCFKMLWSPCLCWVLGVISILLVLQKGLQWVCGLAEAPLCVGFVTNVVGKKNVSFSCSILLPRSKS